MTRVLAHQGGWDEIALVLVPLVIFALLLLGAQRRLAKQQAEGTEPGGDRDDADIADDA